MRKREKHESIEEKAMANMFKEGQIKKVAGARGDWEKDFRR
jgi:hypothetical protein